MNKITFSHLGQFRIMDSVSDQSGNKIPVIYGPLSATEVASAKGYRYKEGFWRNVLSRASVKEVIDSRRMLGMIEHPIEDSEYLSTPYEKASHLVIAVDLQGSTPYGQMALLNNPLGNTIKALADLKVPIGVSTRGMGSYEKDDISQFIDDESFGLITWDFTRNPNLKGSDLYMKVTDSLQNSPLFSEFAALQGIRDSAEHVITREEVLEELAKMKTNLNNIIKHLS